MHGQYRFSMHTAVNFLPRFARRYIPFLLLWLTLGTLAACSGGGGGGGNSASAPVANNGTVTTLEDSSVDATLSASDPSGKPLTFRVVTNPGKGMVVIDAATGSYTYTPNPNANGADSFTFVANNGSSDSNVATISITITPVNDPPVAVNDSYTVPAGPNQPYTVTANCAEPDPNKRGVLCNDTDPDGAPPTKALIAMNVSHGTLTLNQDGSFTYTHDGTTNWNNCGGQPCDSFTYYANDGSLNSNSPATVILYEDQPPVASNACVAPGVNTPVNGQLTATDPQGLPLTYTLLTTAGKGTVNLDAAGNFSYTPNLNAVGLDKFTYQVTDSFGLTATGSAWAVIGGTIRIMPVGDSITAGYPGGSGDTTGSLWVGYRYKLYNDLVARYGSQYGIDFVGTVTNLGTGFTPPLADRDNEGHDAWRDDEIANGPDPTPLSESSCSPLYPLSNCNITGWLDDNPPDVVLLHIGTNGINDAGGTSAADVATILDDIKAWGTAHGSPVTVMLALIIGSPDATTNANVTTFNYNVSAMAQTRIINGDPIVLVNQQTGAGLIYQLAPAGDMGDNLHPVQAGSGAGYDKMADKWKADLISSGVLPSCP